jgi:hypothetical protein
VVLILAWASIDIGHWAILSELLKDKILPLFRRVHGYSFWTFLASEPSQATSSARGTPTWAGAGMKSVCESLMR